MDVSIVIVNYNTLKVTQQCINSVFEKTSDVSFEVILVDNSSNDGSKEIFEADNRIIYIYLDYNAGFGRANNIGLTKATGEYILFLNSDTVLLNNAIKIMHDIFLTKKKNKIGALGCMLSDINGKFVHSYGRFFTMSDVIINTIKAYFKNPFKKNMHVPQGVSAKEDFFRVDYVTGADMMVPMSIIRKLGAFDSAFFMYCEDCYMQYVYTQQGFSSYISVKPHIIHLESVSTKNNAYNLKKKILIERSRFIYLKKIYTPIQYKLFRFFYFILRSPFIIKPGVSFYEKKEYFHMLLSPVKI